MKAGPDLTGPDQIIVALHRCLIGRCDQGDTLIVQLLQQFRMGAHLAANTGAGDNDIGMGCDEVRNVLPSEPMAFPAPHSLSLEAGWGFLIVGGSWSYSGTLG